MTTELAPRTPCSTAARARGDQRVGTAPLERRWFLVEQPTDWQDKAWAGLQAREDVKSQLQTLLESTGTRLMLIRRHGGGGSDPLRIAVVDPDADEPLRWFARTGDQDLLEVARLIGQDTPAAAQAPSPIATGGPLIMVCTHGRKDQCCATRGRPVARALNAQWPEQTWECSHTGGDRFAANVIVLPDGAAYGGLDPEEAVAVVGAHVAGQVEPDRLRGLTGHPPHVQAAFVATLERLGPLAWGDVRVLTQYASALDWQVELEVTGQGAVRVSGGFRTSAPAFLTCKAVEPAPKELPVVEDFRQG